jgi:hypothetical protein
VIHLRELEDELVEAEVDVEPVRPHRDLVFRRQDDRMIGVLRGSIHVRSSPGRRRSP